MKSLSAIIILAILSVNCIAQKQNQNSNQDSIYLKRKVIIVPFTNDTDQVKAKSYDKENDPLPQQGFDNLASILNETQKFFILKRLNKEKLMKEIDELGELAFQEIGIDYIILGSISKLGKKDIDNKAASSKSKTLLVEATVSIQILDILSELIIYSGEASGEAESNISEGRGSGKKNNYDPAVSDKAISEAISKLTDSIINSCLKKPWKTYFLTHDVNGITISGGKSQGFKAGDIFNVIERGKITKNEQTGERNELPGKVIGQTKIELLSGDIPSNEYSVVSYKGEKLDEENLFKYFI